MSLLIFNLTGSIQDLGNFGNYNASDVICVHLPAISLGGIRQKRFGSDPEASAEAGRFLGCETLALAFALALAAPLGFEGLAFALPLAFGSCLVVTVCSGGSAATAEGFAAFFFGPLGKVFAFATAFATAFAAAVGLPPT